MLLAIAANDIDTAGLAVDAALPTAWLEAELSDASVTAKAPGRITGRLSRSGNDIVVRAKVHASLTLPCARCLDPSALDVDTELSLLLRPAAPAPRPAAAKGGKKVGAKGAAASARPAKAKPKADEEYEFSAAEADVDTYEGDTVVLDRFVREAVLLELPNFPLCSDSCPGIRPALQHEGADPSRGSGPPPLDPRLAPLAALRLNGSGGLLAGGDPQTPAASAVSKKTKKKE